MKKLFETPAIGISFWSWNSWRAEIYWST